MQQTHAIRPYMIAGTPDHVIQVVGACIVLANLCAERAELGAFGPEFLSQVVAPMILTLSVWARHDEPMSHNDIGICAYAVLRASLPPETLAELTPEYRARVARWVREFGIAGAPTGADLPLVACPLVEFLSSRQRVVAGAVARAEVSGALPAGSPRAEQLAALVKRHSQGEKLRITYTPMSSSDPAFRAGAARVAACCDTVWQAVWQFRMTTPTERGGRTFIDLGAHPSALEVAGCAAFTAPATAHPHTSYEVKFCEALGWALAEARAGRLPPFGVDVSHFRATSEYYVQYYNQYAAWTKTRSAGARLRTE